MSYTTPAGYTPVSSMPAIAAPASGSSTAYYSGLGLTVTATDMGANGIKFEVSGPSLDLLAMSGGLTYYVPSGTLLPDGVTPSPSPGTMVTQTHLPDLVGLRSLVPPGVPYMSYSLLQGVTPSSAQTALTPFLADVPDQELDDTWDETQTPAASTQSRPTKEAHYLSRVMLGERSLFVPGGTTLGEATVNTMTSQNEFTLAYGIGSPSAGNYTPISPALFLRELPVFSDPQWADHPFITATSGITPPLDVYIRFEVYNPATQTFLPVDAGLTIELKKHVTSGNDSTEGTGTTDATGLAHINIAGGISGNPDLYFNILNPTSPIFEADGVTPITLPSNWATKGNGSKHWNGKSGEAGYYKNFNGSLLGSPNSPLTFRIGLDYHFLLEYTILNNAKNKGGQFRDRVNVNRAVPLGTRIEIYSEKAPRYPLPDYVLVSSLNQVDALTMPAGGVIHGLLFNVEPEEDLFIGVHYQIENLAINFKQVQVYEPEYVWMNSYKNDDYKDDSKLLTKLQSPSIGTHSSPFKVVCKEQEYAKSMDWLYCSSEFAYFIYHLTNGDPLEWPGVPITIKPWMLSAFSWPIGVLRMTDNKGIRFSRDTLVHETAHQLFWWAGNYNNGNIAHEALFSELKLFHFPNKLANKSNALLEGWAEFFENVFAGYNYYIQTVRKRQGTPDLRLMDEINRGEKVEGLVAAALTEIFYEIVVTSANNPQQKGGNYTLSATKLNFAFPTYYTVDESYDGDPTTRPGNAWLLNAGVQDRFIDIIWKPVCDINYPVQEPDSRIYMELMLNNPPNAANAHLLRGYWQAHNIGVDLPTFTSLSVAGGTASTSGSSNVTITGSKFSQDDGTSYRPSLVYWDLEIVRPSPAPLKWASNVQVTSSTQITASVPALPAGTYDVRLVLNVRGTRAREVTLTNGITYA